jgi:nucleoside-diphosphate-sugar epimerase
MSPAPASDAAGPGRRVWITGHGGFTGRYLSSALHEAGFEPVAASELPTFDLRNVESIERELARARPEYVIHLAAVTFVAHGRASDFYEVNTVGTAQLLECLARSAYAPRKVIVASSANIYGNARVEPITEDTPPAPVNHYACSKLAMELMTRTYFDRLPILIVRPFNYTGVGQPGHFLVPKLVRHYAERAPSIKLGNLDVVRDFSDVRMLAAAYCRLLAGSLVSTEVNICSGNGWSLQAILDRLSALTQHAPRIEVDPALVRGSEVKRLVGGSDRLARAVGALPFADFGATLAWMLDRATPPAAPAAI